MALEYLAVLALSEQGNKPAGTAVVKIELGGGKAKISNFPGLVFSLVHPWVELHTDKSTCEGGDDNHEYEYENMLEVVEKALEGRAHESQEED